MSSSSLAKADNRDSVKLGLSQPGLQELLVAAAEASGKAQCRWVAINHGTSENGNDHIHIAVSLVREDGTKASTHGDYKRAQRTCRELETKYGLEELSGVHATRGYDRAEKATAVRDEREMRRASLARKVRASASASGSEAEFVRGARDTGLLVRPRYAKNTTDVIVGYSVAERPPRGGPSGSAAAPSPLT